MNIWIVRRECLKHVFLPRINFIVALLMKTSVMLTIPMPKRFGKRLIWLQCVNTMFETFREMSLNFYHLDPLHYFSSPGLSWDACLKMTKQPLDLFTDPDKYLFTEKGMRGGVSAICNRYAKANNPYLSEGYDPTEEASYITYLDCNNLYGYCCPYAMDSSIAGCASPYLLESFGS